MRNDLLVRSLVRGKLKGLASAMAAHEATPRIDADEEKRLQDAITPFGHTRTHETLIVGGVDGTGDFPSLTYSDSLIYVTLSQGTRYRADPHAGLREVAPELEPLVEFTWLTEDATQANPSLDASFEQLAGLPIADVIGRSDYRTLKKRASGRSCSVAELADGLIRPHGTDAGNVAIQLRASAELGAALRLITGEPTPDYVLIDSTLSLPFVNRASNSLFFEHLKRLCCVEAVARGVGFFALSKSHGLPAMEHLERLAACRLGKDEKDKVEHWFVRIPIQARDGWTLSLVENRHLPPVGAVSYLVRFHRNTPVMRLDMDLGYWEKRVRGATDDDTRDNERRIFQDLDYASHDQRAYGYPYPIKAGHDRASLTQAERVALRRLIISEAVAAGMKPQLFRNVSQATGHG
ncbi:hypothetical protein [uncultured Thiohalocapsa sp.]|uniref:hypothetical protein n=1 Tax=uncultured Thiohalocapsa sp. TaxID=768990 RepID=UPI0025EE5E5F|nr:hypothetical protein [uncultured Thiohalocapsa sp.]